MPIYEFACDKCETEREVDCPMSESGQEVICSCGIPMRRVYSAINFAVPQTGRDRVLGTLNQEEGAQDFPGGDMHRDRYEKAMAKGLDQTRPVIGRGFG